jgi:hypothetical protein
MAAAAPPTGPGVVQVVARLRTNDGRLVEHACAFEAGEWALLQRFGQFADELRSTELVSKPGGLRWSQRFDDEGTRFEILEEPARDSFRALLHAVRPFVLADEETSFGKIRKLLARRLDDPDFRRYLEREKARFNGTMPGKIQFVADGVLLNSDEIVRKWLNAYEYHRDRDKAQEIEALHDGEIFPLEMTRMHVVDLVLDKTRAVLELFNAVRSLERNIVIEPFPDQ